MLKGKLLETVGADLDEALLANRQLGAETLVLEMNENSELLPVSKESSREFFRIIFATEGPLWGIYSETGTGYRPEGARHLNFIGGRMYFCKNVEKRYMRFPGPEKEILFQGGEVVERTMLSLGNVLLALTYPFDAIANALDMSLLPLYLEEKTGEFLGFRQLALDEYGRMGACKPRDARELLLKASEAMRFSFISSIAGATNARIPESPAWKFCEAEELFRLSEAGEASKAVEEFGFHSECPYDMSLPRLSENPKSLTSVALPPPKNKYARWRENCKFLCSRYLFMARKAFLEAGKESGLGESVFHLNTPELEEAVRNPEKLRGVAEKRKRRFLALRDLALPRAFVFNGRWETPESAGGLMKGIPAGDGSVAEGVAVFVNDEGDYSKQVAGKVIVSRALSPNLARLLKGAAGIISEGGGVLSHSAIIAREMGVPCVVQVRNFGSIKEGDKLRVDGRTGEVTVV